MGIRNLDQYKDYIFRALGSPLVNVNVTQEQFEDRFAEALEHYNLYHADGVTREHMRFRIKASEIALDNNSEIINFKIGYVIKGVKSGATVTITEDHRRSGFNGGQINTVSTDDSSASPSITYSYNADGTRDDVGEGYLLCLGFQGDFIPGEQVVMFRGGRRRTSTVPDIQPSIQGNENELDDYFLAEEKKNDPLFQLVESYYVAPQWQPNIQYFAEKKEPFNKRTKGPSIASPDKEEFITREASLVTYNGQVYRWNGPKDPKPGFSPANIGPDKWYQPTPEQTGGATITPYHQKYIKGKILTNDEAKERMVVPIQKHVIDTRYIELPEDVFGVIGVLSVNQATASKNIFDLQYQLRLHDLYDLTSTSLIHYKQVLSYLQLLHLELNGHVIVRFNRRQGRLHLDVNYDYDLLLGSFFLVEGYRAVYPDVWNRVYDDNWLKHYTTALVKRQWGMNLKKHTHIALMGGVELDGQLMYDEAVREIQALEEKLRDEEPVLEFFIG